MKGTWLSCLTLPLVLLGQTWQENFTVLKQSQSYRGETFWQAGPKVKMTSDGHAFTIRSIGHTPCVSRYIPVNLLPSSDRGSDHLQIRFTKTSGRCLFSTTSFDKGAIQDWFYPRPGLYTIPLADVLRTKLQPNQHKKQTISLNIYFNGALQFNELSVGGYDLVDGIFFSVVDSKGRKKTTEETAKTGDTLTIDMPLSAKPDNLSLFLYTINDSSNWAWRGKWETLLLPGAPLELTATENPKRYRASFKLEPVHKGLNLTPGHLIAAVNYLGADSNNRGYYYGLCPYAIKLDKGNQPSIDAALKIFDFGPRGSAVHPGAIGIGDNLTTPHFKWIRRPNSFKEGFRKTLDPLMMDWAQIAPQQSAEMEITVKPGKYSVTMGLGGSNTMCWLNHQYRPLSAVITINERPFWQHHGQEKDRFMLMYHDARNGEDLYDTYMKPFLYEPEAVVNAPDGRIRIKVTAGKRNVPLNYVAIYPQDKRQITAKLESIRNIRKKKFNEYWIDETPTQKQLSTLLTAQNLRKGNEPFAVFPRDNAFEYIFLQTMPSLTELNRPLNLLTTPGEQTVATMLLRTFKPVRGLTAKLQLKDFPNATLSFNVPYRFTCFNTRKNWIAPNHYLPAGRRNLDENTSHGYRLAFKTPDKLPQGLYRGAVVFSDGIYHCKLPVEIRVTGRKLPSLDDHVIAMLGVNGNYPNAFRFCQEYLGCNTVCLMCGWPHESKFKLDKNGFPIDLISAGGKTPEWLRNWFTMYKEANFPVRTPFVSLQSAWPTLPYQQGQFKNFSKAYNQALRLSYETIRDAALKEGNCTGIIADLGGEMGHDTKTPPQAVMNAAKKVFRLVSAIPHVKASYRCNCDATTQQFYPELQVQGIRGAKSWRVSDRQSRRGQDKHLYTYSIEGRFLNGFHSWAHGARGNLREWLNFSHAIEYNDFICAGHCGGTFHFEAMNGPNNQLIPTIRSDAFRASVADRQYLRMLENHLINSKFPQQRENATRFQTILRTVITQLSTIHGISYQNANNPWPGLHLELIREIIVQLCDDLDNGTSTVPQFKLTATPQTIPLPSCPKNDWIMKATETDPHFDDHSWTTIRTGTSWESQGFAYDGAAWYRKKITIPKDWKKPFLRIGAADEQAWVFCNGRFLGHHDGWDKAFTLPLGENLPNQEATIAILVYDSTAMGGIWRPVSLHQNQDDAQNKVNGVTINEDWKFALAPGNRKLDVFKLANGPFVAAGTKQAEIHIQLIPDTMEKLNRLSHKALHIKVLDTSGKRTVRANIGKITPYNLHKLLIDIGQLSRGRYRARLEDGNHEFAAFEFYVLNTWKPQKF